MTQEAIKHTNRNRTTDRGIKGHKDKQTYTDVVTPQYKNDESKSQRVGTECMRSGKKCLAEEKTQRDINRTKRNKEKEKQRY